MKISKKLYLWGGLQEAPLDEKVPLPSEMREKVEELILVLVK